MPERRDKTAIGMLKEFDAAEDLFEDLSSERKAAVAKQMNDSSSRLLSFINDKTDPEVCLRASESLQRWSVKLQNHNHPEFRFVMECADEIFEM